MTNLDDAYAAAARTFPSHRQEVARMHYRMGWMGAALSIADKPIEITPSQEAAAADILGNACEDDFDTGTVLGALFAALGIIVKEES